MTINVGFNPNLGNSLDRMNQNRTTGGRISGGHCLGNGTLAGRMAALGHGGVLPHRMSAAEPGRLRTPAAFGLYVSGLVLFTNLLGCGAVSDEAGAPRSFAAL